MNEFYVIYIYIYTYIRIYAYKYTCKATIIRILSHVLAGDICLKCLFFGLGPAIPCSPARGFWLHSWKSVRGTWPWRDIGDLSVVIAWFFPGLQQVMKWYELLICIYIYIYNIIQIVSTETVRKLQFQYIHAHVCAQIHAIYRCHDSMCVNILDWWIWA